MIDFLINYDSWIWLGILIICLIIEALTMSLTTIWGAISALPMIFIAKTPLPFQWQLLIFVILTVVLIIFTRPFAEKKLKSKDSKTNLDVMIGEEVIVTKKISNFEKGEVKAKNGVIWSATTNNSSSVEENTVCKILDIKGNTLIIEGEK